MPESVTPSVVFTPTVVLTERTDGRFDVEVDWADSCIETDQDDARVVAACNAVTGWSKRQPRKFIIPAVVLDPRHSYVW